MTPSDKAKYEALFDTEIGPQPAENDYFVYLRCIPEASLARAKIRARSEECALTLEYLYALHGKFESFVALPDITNRTVVVDVTRKNLKEVVDAVALAVQTISCQACASRNPLKISCDVAWPETSEILKEIC